MKNKIWFDIGNDMLQCGILSDNVVISRFLSWTTVYSNSDRHIMKNVIVLLLLLLQRTECRQ